MSALNPNLIFIGPFPEYYKHWGAEIFSDLHSARHALKNPSYEVLTVSLTAMTESRFSDYWEEIKKFEKRPQLILITPDNYPTKEVTKLFRKFHFFRWRTSYQDPILEMDIASAIERARSLQQSDLLEKLLDQQNKELENFQGELGRRIEKRTKYLSDSRRKLFQLNKRNEIIKRLLISLQDALDFNQLDRLLNETLVPYLNIQWVKLLPQNLSQSFNLEIKEQTNYQLKEYPFFVSDTQVGSLFLLSSGTFRINEDQSEFLLQIREAIGIAWSRIQKYQEFLDLKRQWEATFQAAQDSLAIIDGDYNLIQINHFPFEEHHKKSSKCYAKLFNRDRPCEHCQLGSRFSIVEMNQNFFVRSNSIEFDQVKHYFNIYHPRSEELRLESHILEKARQAELGTIGSSIAHELNNPLGGLLTYIQMIKMDLDKKHPLYEDIIEMESGALRSRDIIQSLLDFSRAPDLKSQSQIDLSELANRTLKISEIFARSHGIELEFVKNNSVNTYYVFVNGNLLAQAFRTFVQIAMEILIQKISLQHQIRKEKLEFKIEATNDVVAWTMTGDFEISLIEQKFQFAWSMAEQIIHDQKGKIDLLTGPLNRSTLRIIFSRPVL